MSELWQLEDELKVSEGLHQRNDLQSGLVCIVQHPQNLKQGALLWQHMKTAIEHRQCCDISEELQNVAHDCDIILVQLTIQRSFVTSYKHSYCIHSNTLTPHDQNYMKQSHIVTSHKHSSRKQVGIVTSYKHATLFRAVLYMMWMWQYYWVALQNHIGMATKHRIVL
jgi:hypothetical protein